MTNIRIAAASDLHGNLGIQVPECDLFILAGDYTPLLSSAENQNPEREYEWWVDKFIPWLQGQKENSGFQKCIIGGGNHDCFLEHQNTRDDVYNYTNSFDWIECAWPYRVGELTATVEFDGLNIGVHSITSTIHGRPWPFSEPRKSVSHKIAMNEFSSKIIHKHMGYDIIVSHGPPAMMLDRVNDGDHVGCPELASFVLGYAPRLVVCGHIHEERGNIIRTWNKMARQTKIANVSIVDQNYDPRGGKIRVFELDNGL